MESFIYNCLKLCLFYVKKQLLYDSKKHILVTLTQKYSTMKILNYVHITILLFSIIGCNRQEDRMTSLYLAEQIFDENPDSALNIIKSVSSPDNLHDKYFSQWCLISGKIADKKKTALPPAYQFERAYNWLLKHASIEEQVEAGLFLGRSLATDGEYEKAMDIYITILEDAKENRLYNNAGYICTYIADLYDMRNMQKEAKAKYEEAQILFKKAGNIKSHIYALQNIAREWAFFDSLEYSLKYLTIADSLAKRIEDNEVSSSIHNAFVNIYMMQQLYDRAESHFHQSMSLNKNNDLPNMFCLINLYLITNNTAKAHELLLKIPQNNSKYKYSVKKAFYLVSKSENNYKKALKYLEECKSIIDSVTIAQNNSKILEIETKYNNLKLREKSHKLEVAQQKYIIILCVTIFLSVTIILLYLLYRQRTKNKIKGQELELNNIKLELANTLIELESKRKQLASSKEENKTCVNKLNNDIKKLVAQYKKLQQRKIATSSIFRKLMNLIDRKDNDGSSLTEQLWYAIVSEISETYPNLKIYLLDKCPNLSEQEWQYCCLYMLNFDSNAEAKLLNINPSSVRTKRLRLRQRLNISPFQEEGSLYEYLTNELLK